MAAQIRTPRFEKSDDKNVYENGIRQRGDFKYHLDVYDGKQYLYSLNNRIGHYKSLNRENGQIYSGYIKGKRVIVRYNNIKLEATNQRLNVSCRKVQDKNSDKYRLEIKSSLYNSNGGLENSIWFRFTLKGNMGTLWITRDILAEMDNIQSPVDVLTVGSELTASMKDVTQLFSAASITADTKDNKSPVLADYKSQKLTTTNPSIAGSNERRLVLFINSDIQELDNFMGYITETSLYNAPYMIDTGIGFWINIGPIFGTVDINDVNNRFYLSYERDYQSGNLVNEFIRTSFMPFMEKPLVNEYPTGKDELWYVKYYNPQTLKGDIITQEEFLKYKAAKEAMVKQYLPAVLGNLLKY